MRPGASRVAATLHARNLVALLSDPSRLRPLADLAIVSQRAVGGAREATGVSRRVSFAREAEVLGSRDAELPGPMHVVFGLRRERGDEKGVARRVAGWAELPITCRDWGDCDLVVLSSDGAAAATELTRVHLDAKTPRARIAVDIAATATTVEFRVEPLETGPIQDRVMLRRMLVLDLPERE